MACPKKSARLKVRALSSPTTLLSRGGHLSDIVFHNYLQYAYFILKQKYQHFLNKWCVYYKIQSCVLVGTPCNMCVNAVAVARRPGATRPIAQSPYLSDSGERARAHTHTHTQTSHAHSDEVFSDATHLCTDHKYLSETKHLPKDTGLCTYRKTSHP